MRDLWGISDDGEGTGDVWTHAAPGKSEKREGRHPTQKPVALLERIINASSRPGEPWRSSGFPVTTAGENMIIASGHESNVLARIVAGENVGTLFVGQAKGISPFKRWLGFSAQVRGRIQLDDGARKAILEKGRSLLPIGVVQVQGDFKKGDVVALCDAAGAEFARGLTNYSSTDAHRVLGLRTEQIGELF